MKPSVETIAAVTVLGCLLALAGQMALLMHGHRLDFVGLPPLTRLPFAVAKLSLTVSMFCMVYGTLSWPAPSSTVASLVFFVLLLGGTLVLMLAFHQLGLNLRMGLPRESTTLVSGGVYRFSRNPIYLGLFALMGASLVYAFSLLNFAAVAASVYLHHRIVLSEERFLSGRFPGYEAYCRSVRRYF